MDASRRKRPSFLALQLANEALSGDMLAVSQSENGPQWQRPATSAAGPQPNSIQSFAFAAGSARSLILLNLNINSPVPVTFAGPNAPRGQVNLRQLHAADITANNED